MWYELYCAVVKSECRDHEEFCRDPECDLCQHGLQGSRGYFHPFHHQSEAAHSHHFQQQGFIKG